MASSGNPELRSGDADPPPPGGERIVAGSSAWPTQVEDLPDPPESLWWRGTGDLRLLAARSIAIVGSRDATDYGLRIARDWAAELAASGWCVISGAAFGIDRAAHLGAIAVGGPTVAVLAGGVDVPYPRAHTGLLAEIEHLGGVVSEQVPGAVPRPHEFLRRNRLIAALTRATVVVEAGLRSGALSTARHAAGINRAVLVVPGPVTSPASAGTNRALQDRLGFPVTCARDVVDMVTPVGASEEEQMTLSIPRDGSRLLAQRMAEIRAGR